MPATPTAPLSSHLFAWPPSRLASLATTLAAMLLAATTHAATVTWNVAGDGAWDLTTGNWTGGTGNLYANSDSAIFNNTAGGVITIMGGGVTPTATTVSATAGTYTFTGGPLAGGTLTKSNAGTLVLDSANSLAGSVLVDTNGGVLNVRHGSALGTGTVTVRSGGALELQGGITLGRNIESLAGSGIGSTGAIRNVSGNNTISGNIAHNRAGTGGSQSVTIGSDAGLLTLHGTLSKFGSGAGDYTFAGAGNVLLTGTINNSVFTVTKNGGGTVTFANANTYTGDTNLNNGMILLDGATASFGAGTVRANNGGTLGLQGGYSYSIPAIFINGLGYDNGGAIRSLTGNNTLTSTISLSDNTAGNRIISDSGTLTLAKEIKGNGAQANRPLNLGGAGNINVVATIRSQSGRNTPIFKEGSGTVDLLSANSFAADSHTTINGGTLSVHTGSGSAFSGTTTNGSNVVTVADTSNLVVGQSLSGTGIPTNAYISAITNATTFTISANATADGSPPLTFAAWSSLSTGNLNVSNGTVNLNGGTYTVAATTIGSAAGGSGTITAGTLNATGNYTGYAGSVAANLGESGARTFTKNGTGTVTLTGANTFTGATTINAGTLKLDFSAAGAPTDHIVNNAVNSSALALAGGKLLVTGQDNTANNQRFNGLSFSSNTASIIEVNAGSGTGSVVLNLDNVGARSYNAGSSLDFSTTGTVTLTTTTNNYSASEPLRTQNHANGTVFATVDQETWAMKDAANTAIVGMTTGFTSSTPTSLAGHADLTGGNTTLAGNTLVRTLRFNDNAGRVLDLDGNQLTFDNGALLISDNVATVGAKIVGGTIMSNAAQNNSARELIVHQHSSKTFEIASSLVTNLTRGMQLIKAGEGTLLLSGDNSNINGTGTRGSVTVSQGTLLVGNDRAFGSATQAANLTVSSGGTLDLNGFEPAVNDFNGGATALVTNSSASAKVLEIGLNNGGGTFNGLIEDGNGTLSIRKIGTGSISIANPNSIFTGGVEIIDGTLNWAASGGGGNSFGTGLLTLSGGTFAVSSSLQNTTFTNNIFATAATTSMISNPQEATLTGNLSGSGTIIQFSNNAKNLIFTGDNSAFAGTFINTPALNPSTGGGANPNSIRFSSTTAGSAAAAWVVGNTTSLAFASGTLQLGSLSGIGTVSKNNLTGGGAATLEVGGRNEDSVFAGVLTQSGGGNSLALNKVGTGTLSLYGANIHSGGTTVSAGTLNLATIAGSGQTALSGATNQRLIQLATDGAASLVLGQAVTGTGIAADTIIALIDYANDTITLNKNTTAAVDGNSLSFGALAGSLGAVTVTANASLAGTGTVGTISGAGSVDPGDSPGLLTATQVDPTGGLDFNFEFTLKNAAPTWAAVENDVLRLTDPTTAFTAALDGDNVISLYLSNALYTGLVDGDVLYGGFYTDAGDTQTYLEDATLAAFFQDDDGPLTYAGLNYSPVSTEKPFGVSFALGMVANDEFAAGGYLATFTATVVIPEPASLVLLAVGALGLLRRRR